MHRWGVGPRFGVLTAVYAAIVYILHTMFVPNWIFSGGKGIGIVFFVSGVLMLLYTLLFNRNHLRTKGLYSRVRHPIYSSWIVLILPGIVLYWGSFLGISIPIFAYIIFKKYIHIKEDYFLRIFGLQYRNYMEETNALFPKLF